MIMVVVVRLKDGSLVPGTPTNSVMDRHNVSKLVEGLEDVNANSTVQARRLQHPKVLIIVTAVR
jgi:hypothetical protein